MANTSLHYTRMLQQINEVFDELGWNGDDLTVTANSLVLSSNTGKGVMVDVNQPTYPFFDLLGEIHIDEAGGSTKPDFNIYKGNIKQYQFAVDDHVFGTYHLPHDYVPNSNIFIHVHWSTNAVSSNSAGTPVFEIEATYAKGFGQMQFSNNVTVTCSNAYINSYTHMVSEVQLSSPSGTGGLLVTGDLETDGIIIIRTRLLSNTLSVQPFLHHVDIHYQSTNIGTKNKSPAFYT